MSAKPRKKMGHDVLPDEYIDVEDIAKNLKPGETKQVGDLLIIPVFVCDPPEPITNYGKRKPPKKRKK